MNAVDQIFAEAERLPWFELDLPRPPSVNRFKGKLGNKSPVVKSWIGTADKHIYITRSVRKLPHIKGSYEVEFVFSRQLRNPDLDNCIKPLMDYLQRVALIENDRFCERLVAYWGPAPLGVKVRLRPWMNQTGE